MKRSDNMNRRGFIRKSGQAVAAATAALSFPAILTSKSDKTPPNVIYIICDQMRGDALSCLGNPNARTPNLDKMASEGVLFDNYFSNNPVCVPSRISNFTGLYPHQHGQLTNKSNKVPDSIENSMLGYFRQHGYQLGWVGKNHTFTKPVVQNIDYAKIRDREKFRAYSKFVPPYWHSDTFWPDEQCYPHLNTEDSIEFLKKAKKTEPFFLHISYFDPHPPYFADAAFTSQYCAQDMKLPPFVSPENLSPRFAEQWHALHYDRIRDEDLLETIRYYYASIEWGVDRQVGRILQTLSETGLDENTIVLFTSDHGDFMGEYRMVRKGMFLYDALLHVPFICFAPGLIKKGIRVQNLAQGVDIFPTLADMSVGKIPDGLPGRSLKPLIQGIERDEPDFTVFASAKYSDLISGYFDNPEPAYNPDSDVPFHTRVERLTWQDDKRTIMARTRDWKLILNESRSPELYKMAGGWTEQENLAGRNEYQHRFSNLEKKIKSEWDWV